MDASVKIEHGTGTLVGVTPGFQVVVRQRGKIIYATPGMVIEPDDELSTIEVDITGPQS